MVLTQTERGKLFWNSHLNKAIMESSWKIQILARRFLKKSHGFFFNPYFNNDIIFLVLALKIKHQIIVSIARKRQNHNVRSSWNGAKCFNIKN